MTEVQLLKPRSRFVAAALSAALVAGMAPSFAFGSQAYADEGTMLAPGRMAVQGDDATVDSVSIIAEGDDQAQGNYSGGVKIVVSSSAHDLSMVGDGDTVTLNGTEFSYKAATNTADANKFRVGGWASPYNLYLTSEAASLLVEGQNTLAVKSTDADCGEFSVSFTYDAAASEQEVGIEWAASFFKGKDDYYIDYDGVNLAPATDGTQIDAAYKAAITGVTVGETQYTAVSSSSSLSGNTYAVSAYAITIDDKSLVAGENTVTVKADGYKDVVLTVVYDASVKTASLKAAVQPSAVIADAWAVSYKADDYNAAYDVVALKSAAGSFPAGFDAAVTGVSVNGNALSALTNDDFGIVTTGKYYAKADALDVAAGSLSDGENKVVIEATGYETAELTVFYNATLKIASLEKIVDISASLENGVYALGTKAITESTYGTGNEREFSLASQFDPNIKLTKSDEGLALTLLYASSVDMRKIAIDGVEATKAAYGKESMGAFEFTCPISDLAQPHKLSFTYFTGDETLNVPQAGIVNGVATHSVYLTDFATSAWEGYSNVVSFGSEATPLLKGSKDPRTGAVANRIYAVPVALKKAESDDASMAAGVFAKSAQLSIDDQGAATLHVALGSVMGSFASSYEVFNAATASGDVLQTTVVSTRKDAEGNDVPLVIEMPVPSVTSGTDYVYLQMYVGAMGRATQARLKVDYANAEGAAASDVEKADEVTAEIAALPLPSALEAKDEEAVKSARANYDALTDAQKAYAHATALSEAEAKISELKEAAAQEAAAKEAAEKEAAEKAAKEAAEKEAAEKAAKEAAEKEAAEKAAKEAAEKEAAEKAAKEAAAKEAAEKEAAEKAATSATKAKAAVEVTKSKSIKAAKVRGKAVKFVAFKVTTDGKVAYKVVKKDAKKVLSFKKGKVTVKKGAKPGTYKLKVKVSAKAGKNYKALKAKTYTIKVKVKK